MSTAMWKPAGPMSSAEFQTVDSDRLADIQHKHAAVKQLLAARQLDAILLQRPLNFAWFTSGGDCSRGGSSDASAALFVTPEARVVVTSNAESAQLFDRELQGLGFQLKERRQRRTIQRHSRYQHTAQAVAGAADIDRVSQASRIGTGAGARSRSHVPQLRR